MIEQGDVYLADVNGELQWKVLVVSTGRFNTLSGRTLIAPEIPGAPDEVPQPWHVRFDDSTFALDRLRAIGNDRLLRRLDRAPHDAVSAVRRALRHIT